MPWESGTIVERRLNMVREAQRGERPQAVIARAYGVSRKTLCKWLARFEESGREGLHDESRRPKSSPNQVDESVCESIISLRQQHPTWGPKKLLVKLEREWPRRNWPSAVTVWRVLKENGLSQRRRRHASEAPKFVSPLVQAERPNHVWSVDFKGEFRLGDGQYCYPLTMMDSFSRYLLRCEALRSTAVELSKPVFERAFREHGLPEIVRSDNGVPFASNGGLSPLSVWLIKLGVVPQRTAPGKPTQNARHERMHRTLKFQATMPPEATFAAQQKRFDAFRREYNDDRPHEQLGQRRPSEFYAESPRELPRRVPEPSYPKSWEVRTVSDGGVLSWRSKPLFLSASLRGERVGLEPVDDGLWLVHFGRMQIGILDERTLKLTRTSSWRVSPMS